MVEAQYQKVPGIKLTAEPKKNTSGDYTDHSSSYRTEVSKAPEDAVNTHCDRKKYTQPDTNCHHIREMATKQTTRPPNLWH